MALDVWVCVCYTQSATKVQMNVLMYALVATYPCVYLIRVFCTIYIVDVEVEVVESGKHISKTLNIVGTGDHNHFAICSLFIIADEKVFLRHTRLAHTQTHVDKINCDILHNANCKLQYTRRLKDEMYEKHTTLWRVCWTENFIRCAGECLYALGKNGGIQRSFWQRSETTHQTDFPSRSRRRFVSSFHALAIHSWFLNGPVILENSFRLDCEPWATTLSDTSSLEMVPKWLRRVWVESHAASIFHAAFSWIVKQCSRRLHRPQWPVCMHIVHCTRTLIYDDFCEMRHIGFIANKRSSLNCIKYSEIAIYYWLRFN